MDCRDYCIEGCAIVSHAVVENEAFDETDGAEGGDGDPADLPAGAFYMYVHEDEIYVGLYLRHPHRSSMQPRTTNLVETNATAQRNRVGSADLTGDGNNDVVSPSTAPWDWY